MSFITTTTSDVDVPDGAQQADLVHSQPPVFGLPDDILSLIFAKCMHPLNMPRLDASPTSSRSILLGFSQVCRRWRHVAVGDPRLWTSICLDKPQLARLMLSRTGDAPFDMLVDVYADLLFDNGVIQEGLARYATLRKLSLNGSEATIRDLLALITGPMDVLMSLDIRVEDTTSGSYLLHLNAPQLHVLRLRNILLPWTSTGITNLTSLEITRGNGALNISEVLEALARNRSLKKLYLDQVIAPDSAEKSAAGASRQVTLDQLLSIRLAEGVNTLNALLSCLVIPQASSCFYENVLSYAGGVGTLSFERAVRTLLDTCRSWLSTLCQATESIWVSFEENNELMFHINLPSYGDGDGETEDKMLNYGNSDGETEDNMALLTVRLRLREECHDAMVDHVLQRFLCDSVRTCTVSSWTWNVDISRRVLDQMATLPNLTDLILRLRTIDGFLPIFEAVGPDSAAPFPTLRTLRLRYTVLFHVHPILRVTPLRRLAVILKTLKDSGRPIGCVELSDCYAQSCPWCVLRNYGVDAKSQGCRLVGQDLSELHTRTSIPDAAPYWVRTLQD